MQERQGGPPRRIQLPLLGRPTPRSQGHSCPRADRAAWGHQGAALTFHPPQVLGGPGGAQLHVQQVRGVHGVPQVQSADRARSLRTGWAPPTQVRQNVPQRVQGTLHCILEPGQGSGLLIPILPARSVHRPKSKGQLGAPHPAPPPSPAPHKAPGKVRPTVKMSTARRSTGRDGGARWQFSGPGATLAPQGQ